MLRPDMKNWTAYILGRYRLQFAQLLCLQLLAAPMVAMQPLYFQKLVSVLISQQGGPLFRQAAPFVSILVVLTICVSLLQGISGAIGAVFSAKLLKDLQVEFFERMIQLPNQIFQQQATGDFFTRFTHDVGQAQRFAADFIPTMFREGVTSLGLLFILGWFCPFTLVLASVGVVGLTSLIVVKAHQILDRYAARQRDGWVQINKEFEETVQGLDTLKTFGSESERFARFAKHTASYRAVSKKAGKTAARYSPVLDMVGRLGTLLLLLLAAWLLGKGRMELDTFFLFFFCSALLQGSIAILVSRLTGMQSLLEGVKNLAQFFAHPVEEEEEETVAVLAEPQTIAVNNLHFRYAGGQELYHGKSFNIPATGITLIQGENGSGKSTFIDLLLRFYKSTKGSITIGDEPIEQFSRKELRQKISVVTQFHHIFHDSLRNNLLVANPGATDREIGKALSQVGLDYLQERCGDGLDEIIDPRGKGLSGGEKQRICIARLLLKQAPVMVLDEPFANLDGEAREVLKKIIRLNAEKSTVILISHTSLEYDQDYKMMITLKRRM